jgi:hypothetical protein
VSFDAPMQEFNQEPPQAQAAHCESGVVVELLRSAGVQLSEPLVFGIGSGLFFTHLPFVQVTGHAVTAFRSMPGSIFHKVVRRVGLKKRTRRFASQRAAEEELDRLVLMGQPVGLRTNIQWLNYFPRQFRFNFNGHHLIVRGKIGDHYQILDPVVDTPVTCHRELLLRARFATGPLAPKGFMFYLDDPLASDRKWDLAQACRLGLQETARRMTRIPLPYFGTSAIGLMARRIQKLVAKRVTEERICDELAFIVRMQEEIGTGGAGFRYLFAAFLEEASAELRCAALGLHVQTMTNIGDQWREFAGTVSRMCKGRVPVGQGVESVSRSLSQIATAEWDLFSRIGRETV